MSTNKPNKKKVVVTTTSSNDPGRGAAQPRTRATAAAPSSVDFTFSRQTYIWMGVGFALVVLGMILMGGGHMPNSNTWDDSIIYSTRRTLLAPIVILAGLAVEVFAIFKK
jgi:hypothetical protein